EYPLQNGSDRKIFRGENFLFSFPDSSMVEQPAVNRFVVGSSPTRGAERGGANESATGVTKRRREDHLLASPFSWHVPRHFGPTSTRAREPSASRPWSPTAAELRPVSSLSRRLPRG